MVHLFIFIPILLASFPLLWQIQDQQQLGGEEGLLQHITYSHSSPREGSQTEAQASTTTQGHSGRKRGGLQGKVLSQKLGSKLNEVPLQTQEVQYSHENKNPSTKSSNLCTYLWSKLSLTQRNDAIFATEEAKPGATEWPSLLELCHRCSVHPEITSWELLILCTAF